MLSFFRKQDSKKTGKDTSFASADIAEHTHGEQEDTHTSETVQPTLSIHPKWRISTEQTYVYRFLNQDLPEIAKNQIGFSAVNLQLEETHLLAVAFVRSSAAKAVTLGELDVFLLSSDDQVFARQKFDGAEIGELQPNTSRPWGFRFDMKNIKKEEIPEQNWRIAIHVPQENRQTKSLDLTESWEKQLTTEQISQLEQAAQSLPPVAMNELNMTGISAQYVNDEKLAVTALIRSGYPKKITIPELPVQVFDASSNLLVEATFTFKEFTIAANSAKPWTFVFDRSQLAQQDADITRFLITFPNATQR